MKKGNWYGIDVCSNCNKELSFYERMHTEGICPHCGYNSRSTVCNTEKVVIRKVKQGKWWQFKKSYYEGLNEFSKEWIKNN